MRDWQKRWRKIKGDARDEEMRCISEDLAALVEGHDVAVSKNPGFVTVHYRIGTVCAMLYYGDVSFRPARDREPVTLGVFRDEAAAVAACMDAFEAYFKEQA